MNKAIVLSALVILAIVLGGANVAAVSENSDPSELEYRHMDPNVEPPITIQSGIVLSDGFESGYAVWKPSGAIRPDMSQVQSGNKAIYINSSRTPIIDRGWLAQTQHSIPEESSLSFWIFPERLLNTDPQVIEVIRDWNPQNGDARPIAMLRIFATELEHTPWASGMKSYNYAMPLRKWHHVEIAFNPGNLAQYLSIDGQYFGQANGTNPLAPETIIFGDVSLYNDGGAAYYDNFSLSSGGYNFIKNGDFENATIAPWFSTYFPKDRDSLVHSGQISLYVGNEAGNLQYAYRPISPPANLSEYMVRYWVNPTRLTSNGQIFKVKTLGDTVSSVIMTNSSLTLTIWKPSAGGGASKTFPYVMSTSKWHNITVHVVNSTGTQSLYVDRTLFGSLTYSGNRFAPQDVLIGNINSGMDGGNVFYDDVLIYDLPSNMVVTANANPNVMRSGETSSITIKVTDGSSSLPGVEVNLSSSKGGKLVPLGGYTDGNGNFTATFTAPIVVNQTICRITALANIGGFTNGSAYVDVTVDPLAPPPSVTLIATPMIVKPKGVATITVHVADGSTPLPGATVNISSNNGGSINPQYGSTDNNGSLTVIFTAPNAIKTTICRITANVEKMGFNNSSGYVDVTVEVVLPNITVTINAVPTVVKSGEYVAISVRVFSGSNPLLAAAVELDSNSGGSFSPKNGFTNVTGDFTSTFTTPMVNISVLITISANASKSGYASGSGTVSVTVNPTSEPKVISVKVSAYPISLKAGETSLIEISATSNSQPLSGGNVVLTASSGWFDNSTGTTDAQGMFKSKYIAPDVTSTTDVIITADVSKSSYTMGEGTVKVRVEPWTGQKKDMTVSISANKTELKSLETASITVTVREGLVAIPGAKVTVTINAGKIQPISGNTDFQGMFKSMFIAPNVTADTTISITASATKAGYNPAESSISVTVKLERPRGKDNSPGDPSMGIFALVGFAIGATVFFLLLIYVVLIRRKKCPTCRNCIPRGMEKCPSCRPWQIEWGD